MFKYFCLQRLHHAASPILYANQRNNNNLKKPVNFCLSQATVYFNNIPPLIPHLYLPINLFTSRLPFKLFHVSSIELTRIYLQFYVTPISSSLT